MITDHLPAFEFDFPSWLDWGQKERGILPVLVERIIGGSSSRASDYHADWTNKESFDLRYDRTMAFVKERLDPTTSALDLGYIRLFKIGDAYYVCNDGHRRVSAAHVLAIKCILAEVTELFPDNTKLPTAREKARRFITQAMNNLGTSKVD